MADVFVSYAREDEARVGALVRLLEGDGLSVFWDRRIPPGSSWRDHIGRALSEAHCVVVAWSTASVASDFVAEEADDARQRGVLVPVLIDDVLPPLGFRSVQAADLRDLGQGAAPRGAGDFLRAVDQAIGRRPGVATAPVAQSPSTAAPKATQSPPAAPAGSPAPHLRSREASGTTRRLPRAGLAAAAAVIVLLTFVAWFLTRGTPATRGTESAVPSVDDRGPATPLDLRIVDAFRTDDGGLQLRLQVVNRGPRSVTFEASRACALVGADPAPQRATDSRPLFETLQPGEPATFELRFAKAEGMRSLRCRPPGGDAVEAELPPLP